MFSNNIIKDGWAFLIKANPKLKTLWFHKSNCLSGFHLRVEVCNTSLILGLCHLFHLTFSYRLFFIFGADSQHAFQKASQEPLPQWLDELFSSILLFLIPFVVFWVLDWKHCLLVLSNSPIVSKSARDLM